MSEPQPQVCRESESWGAELALGLLSGPDRASALSHLASCPTCRTEVDELAVVADRLLLLAPDEGPPAGFESRVLAITGAFAAPATRRTDDPRPTAGSGAVEVGSGAVASDADGLGTGGPGTDMAHGGTGTDADGPSTDGADGIVSHVGLVRSGDSSRRTGGRHPRGRGGVGVERPGPRGRGRLVGLVAAMVVAAAVGGGVVGSVVRSPSEPEATVVRTGLAVSASGRTSCRVVVSGTRPASVLVSMDGYPGPDTDVTVELETFTGALLPVGAMRVAAGHGLLVRDVDVDGATLRLMRMLDRDGRAIYEAMLEDTSPS